MAVMMLFWACQVPPSVPAPPRPPPTAFSDVVQNPPSDAGVGPIRIDGEAAAAGPVTLDDVARMHWHVRPLSGVPFTKTVH